MPFPTISPTIPALVRSSAAQFGQKAFVVADGRELTYADLERQSAHLAKKLLADGINKGDHVGILMPNGIEWALAWFAVTRIGAWLDIPGQATTPPNPTSMSAAAP